MSSKQAKKKKRKNSSLSSLSEDGGDMAEMESRSGPSNTDILNELKGMRSSIDSKLDKLKNEIAATIENKISGVKDYVDMEISRVLSRIESIETCVSEGGATSAPVKPVESGGILEPLSNTDITVVAIGMHQEANEVIEEKVDRMIMALGKEVYDKVHVVKCLRLKQHDIKKPAIVKIAFNSLQQKIDVLKVKMKLRNCPEFSKVYLRSSKTHTERLLELNAKTLLKEMPNGDDFRVTASGRIVKKIVPNPAAEPDRNNSSTGPTNNTDAQT